MVRKYACAVVCLLSVVLCGSFASAAELVSKKVHVSLRGDHLKAQTKIRYNVLVTSYDSTGVRSRQSKSVRLKGVSGFTLDFDNILSFEDGYWRASVYVPRQRVSFPETGFTYIESDRDSSDAYSDTERIRLNLDVYKEY